jgi:rod shape-determining protein MreC
MLRALQDKTVLFLVLLVAAGNALGYFNKTSLRAGKSFVVQDIARSAVLPFNFASSRIFTFFDHFILAIRPRSLILRENAELRQHVRNLTADNARLRESAYENQALRKAIGLREINRMPMFPAEVISRRESQWFDTATLNKGRRAGVQSALAVVNHYGLVGQITVVNAFSSEVVALTNPHSSVGAMVQRSRSAGIIQGQGTDTLVLNYLPMDASILVGDLIVTSGQGRIVPKGFVIGRVLSVTPNSATGTTSAVVKPSVRFDELEHVFITKPSSDVP